MKRGRRGRSQSLTQKKMFNFPLGSSKRGLDFPGFINYEVFLFSVISTKKKGRNEIKARALGSSAH